MAILTVTKASPASPPKGLALALPLQADGLAVLDPGRNGDFKRAAGRQRDPALAAVDGLAQAHRDWAATSSPRGGGRAAWAPPPPRRAAPNNSLKRSLASKPPPDPARCGTHNARSHRPAAAACPARPGASAEALETLEAWLAFGVDLAAIELAALLLVAENLIGGAHLGEFFLRLGVLALIGMKFLGELAIGLFDFAPGRPISPRLELYKDHASWSPVQRPPGMRRRRNVSPATWGCGPAGRKTWRTFRKSRTTLSCENTRQHHESPPAQRRSGGALGFQAPLRLSVCSPRIPAPTASRPAASRPPKVAALMARTRRTFTGA